MFRKLTIIACIISFCPAAVGAQDLALLANSQPVQERPVAVEPAREINLALPAQTRAATVVAANDSAPGYVAEAQEPKKTHSGMTFKEWCDVHFGEYRWVYWVGAAAVLVAIHAVAAD